MIYYIEEVTEKIGQHVLASTIRVASRAEVKRAKQLFAKNKCSHSLVKDETGWLYDIRICALYGKGLGTI